MGFDAHGPCGFMCPMQTAPDPQLISLKDAARRLSISPKSLQRLTIAGILRSAKIGRRRLYDLRDLERFIADAKTSNDSS